MLFLYATRVILVFTVAAVTSTVHSFPCKQLLFFSYLLKTVLNLYKKSATSQFSAIYLLLKNINLVLVLEKKKSFAETFAHFLNQRFRTIWY